MNKYSFNQLALILIDLSYKYDEVPECVKETAEYLQLLELEAINYRLTKETTQSYDTDKMQN